MLMPDALKEIGEIGQAFADDLDDKLFGKFGFTVRENEEDGATELVATFAPLLPEELLPTNEVSEASDNFGPTQEFVWSLTPVSGHAG